MPKCRGSALRRLEQCVDERRDRGALGEHHETAKHDHHDQYWQQPEFLPDAHKPPKLSNEIHILSLRTDLSSSPAPVRVALSGSSSSPRPAAASAATDLSPACA